MQAAVVGVPGTGKTFFMVAYLKKHFSYDSFFREYTISKDVLILTNIAGLKFYGASCFNVESPEFLGVPSEGIKGKFTREEFFTVKNMESLMEKTGKKNIILALDEVQKDHYFPLGYKDPDVLFLFAYHRHIGMDIILGTQDAALMSRGVLAQCEYLAHGRLRSKKIVGSMAYRFTDNKGGFMYGKSLLADKAVFSAYQSATNDECNKPKNAIVHWFLITAVFLVIAGGLFKTALAIVSSKAKPENARKQLSPSAQKLADSASVVPVYPDAASYKNISAGRAANPVVAAPAAPVLLDTDFIQTDIGYVVRDNVTVLLIGSRMVPLPSQYVKNVDLANRVCDVQVGFNKLARKLKS